MSGASERIEKRIVVRAPRHRVWEALVEAKQFGAWFQIALEGEFAAGRKVRGRITTPGYEHVVMELEVTRVDERAGIFAFRWHPHAVDPNVDYASEPTTLVEFRVEEAPGGTLVEVVESGFERIPAARRSEAVRMNARGWEGQLINVKRHVETN